MVEKNFGHSKQDLQQLDHDADKLILSVYNPHRSHCISIAVTIIFTCICAFRQPDVPIIIAISSIVGIFFLTMFVIKALAIHNVSKEFPQAFDAPRTHIAKEMMKSTHICIAISTLSFLIGAIAAVIIELPYL